jgi:hypothetical protein
MSLFFILRYNGSLVNWMLVSLTTAKFKHLLMLTLLLQNWKDVNHQALNTFQGTWFKPEVKHYVVRSMNVLILFAVRNNCLSSGRNLLLYQFTSKERKFTIVIIDAYRCYQFHTILYPISFFQDYVVEIIEHHQCGVQCNRTTTDQISCIHQIQEKKLECSETVHQLFIEFKKACDSVQRKVLCNILFEFGVPMKLVRLIKMCLNETYSKVCTGKYLSDTFPIQNGLEQEVFLHHCSSTLL